ncbi:MAG: hypothetical protein ABSE56_18095 [Bryobacteraceae bacterium]|jgi:hypothetical protein
MTRDAERKPPVRLRRSDTSKRARLEALLRSKIWPTIPREILATTITRDEEARILGYGPGGH